MSTDGGPEAAREPTGDGPEEIHPTHVHSMHAEASGRARINMAGRDQYIAERDLHVTISTEAGPIRAVDGPVAEECPYPGLAAFGPEQAGWYFGRAKAIAESTIRLAASLTDRTPLVLVSPSGAGKSSLLRAGLLPAIERGALPTVGSKDWKRVVFTPTAHPMAELASRLGLSTAVGGRDDRRAKLCESLKERASGGVSRIVVVVDQLEEVFTLCEDEEERQAFLDELAWLADPGAGHDPAGLVVLGLRADFYARCADHPWLRTAVEQSQLFLGPMSPSELREAIVLPARGVGLEVEPGLVEILLRDLGAAREPAEGTGGYEAGRLPLLAHALLSTWQQRRGHLLTVDGYQTTGGIENAVATTADREFGRLEIAEQDTARNLFLRMVTVTHGADDSRRRVPREDLIRSAADPRAARTVIDIFTKARLLTQERDTVAITHEVLLRVWPQLLQWINDDRVGNVIRQELRDAASSWDRAGRDNDALYRGSRLHIALDAVAKVEDHEIDQVTRAFLDTSRRRVKRAGRIRRRVTAALVALVLVASAAAGYAFLQRNSALAERDAAIFSQVTAEADRLRSTDSSLAAQLDLVAYRMNPQPLVSTHLVNDGTTVLSTPVANGAGAVASVALTPDGHTLASGNNRHTIRLWNVTDPTHAMPLGQPLTVHANTVGSVAFSPDGHTLAAGGNDRTVRLWDVTDPAHPAALGKPLTGHTDTVGSVAFSPDGHTLASGSADATLRLWNVTRPAHTVPWGNPLNTGSGSVSAVVFSPDGHTVASGGSGQHNVRLWNVARPAHPVRLGELVGHTADVTSLAFSPDGQTLASGSYDATIRLWNVTDPAAPRFRGQTLTGHAVGVLSLVFGRNGQTLVSGSADNTLRFWSFPPGMTSYSRGVQSVAFSPDGHTLASAGSDMTIRLWRVTGSARPTALGQPLAGYRGLVSSLAFSPNGNILAGGSYDGTIRLWNVADPARPTALGGPLDDNIGRVMSVAFSPDGHTLASAGYDSAVRLWNVTDPAHPTTIGQPLTGHTGMVLSVAFSPHGRTLVSTGADKTIRLWNVADPAHAVAQGRPVNTSRTGVVMSVAFSPDGHTLAGAGYDGMIRLWDMTGPTHPLALENSLYGHTSLVVSVAFSPDGHTLASAGYDSTVRLWNVTDPAHPTAIGQPLTGHFSAVEALAFNRDGRLVSAGDDGVIRLWDLNPDHVIPWVCAATKNVLTERRWHVLIPQLPYNPPCARR
ncbi:hypothetical protein [Streptomyces sp. NPDC046942]|uniref:nSTAND1 domain-containing NTPase n=1 Tax=Streptomyces sp. NPDC046942 TaxID=3155137 RepID=UPI0033E05B63